MVGPVSTPPISGFEALINEIRDLKRRVAALENKNGRSVAIGTSYRLQISGTGAGAVVQAYRIADGNTVQIAP